MTEKPQDELVMERLEVIGVACLHEWDVLAFLYSHPNSLATAAQIARLIGHDSPQVAAALQKLEGLGLIQRSRAHRGMRFFRTSEPHETTGHSCLEDLMGLAQTRPGRLLLLKYLRRWSPEPRRRLKNSLRFA